VPRAVAVVGGSGSRSITRNLYSSGHVIKSAALDGEIEGPVGGDCSATSNTISSTAQR
jgi:hypothetical protein